MLGGRAYGVYCPHIICVVVCASVWCVVWNGGGGVWSRCLSSLYSSLPPLSLLPLVFGVVRAQPCEHARYPEHHCVLLSCSFLSVSSAFLRAPPFFCWNGGGGFTMCRCVVLA